MFCIEDSSLAKLRGQYINGEGTFLVIQWSDCQLETGCKLAAEIEAFKQETRLIHLHNSQNYWPTIFSDDVIGSSLEIESFYLDGTMNIFEVSKGTLTDQSSYTSIGFIREEIPFYNVKLSAVF